uniref:Variant surface glycoprotein WRATAT A n=1 Tax=Trypanosoma brucei rhodesiense TaxID=31286 RepID=VSWA_TRYBR|nr:RecName: Full=Variant surface glycoprotein WRATAT A; Short=VSG; Flags: Precursor [Trypanosoma brucei rhodesiense]AAA30316.1 WRATat A variant surface glycoprotein [Trypanosoma brucei]
MSVLFLLLAITRTASVKAAEGDQAADFLPLCEAWQATKALANAAYKLPPFPPDLTDILNFNITVAPEEWKAIFTDGGSDNTWERFAEGHKNTLNGGNWKTRWEHIKQARQDTKEASSPWNALNSKLINTATVNTTRAYIASIADEAFDLYQGTQTPLQTPKALEAASLAEAAKAILCSDPLKPTADGQACTDITATPSKAATCPTGRSSKGGAPIGLDTVCLCSTNKPSMHSRRRKAAAVMTDGQLKDGILKKLLAACPKKPTLNEPAAAARHAVTVLATRLAQKVARAEEGQIILGTRAETDCASSGSACVEYTNFFKDGDGLAAVPWVKKLLAAADFYDTIEKRKESDKNAATAIAALKSALIREFRRPGQEQTLATTGTKSSSPQSTQQKASEAEANCNDKAKETECNSPCKWDKEEKDEKKRCKLSEEGKQAEKENQEGKDGKANTTGSSNSFVIKTSPLLLAVLLL